MKIHQYNEMMRYLTRPAPDPSFKQQVARGPAHVPFMAPELQENISPMPNIPDLLREEGIQVGPQVKASSIKQQVASNPLNIPAHMQHQLDEGQLTPEEFYQHQSIPQSERPLTGAEGGRVQYKPGGLVEPGVTHYATSPVKTKKFKYKITNQSGTVWSDNPPGGWEGDYLKIEKDPKFKEWLKTEKIDYDKIEGKHKGNIRKRFQTFLKYKDNIGIKELAEHTPFSYHTLREMIYNADKKIEKQMPYKTKSKIKNAKRVVGEMEKAGIVALDVGKKEWRYKTLNQKKIKALNNIAYSPRTFNPDTMDEMYRLFENKKFMNWAKNYNGGDIPGEILETVFKKGNRGAHAFMQLGRVLQGKAELEGVLKNKKLGDKIVAAMIYDASKGKRGPMWGASYNYVKFDMNKYAGKNMTWDALGDAIKREFKQINQTLPKNSKINNIAIDEVFPIRTGNPRIGELKGADAYSNFVQFIDNEINSTKKVTFDGQSTQRAKKIIAELKKSKPDYELVKKLSQTQDAEIQKFYKENPGTRGKVNLQRFRWDEVNKRFMNPQEIFEAQYKGRYAELPSKIRTGMEKFYSKTGLSIDPGKTFTMLEAQKRPNIEKMLAKAGFNFDHCKLKANGGSYNTCVRDTIEAEQKKALDGDAKSKAKFGKMGKLARGAGMFLGWVDIPIELAFALPHMLRGDVNAAKRATTLGLAGWGSDKELDIARRKSPMAYRSFKRKRDMDNYIDNWFRSEVDKQTLETAPEEFKSDLKQNITTSLTNMENIAKNFPASDPETMYREDKRGREYIREEAEKRARAGLTVGGVKFAPGAEGQKLDTLEKYIKYKGEPYWKNIEPMLEDLNYPDALHPYKVKDERDRYSELPVELASELGPLEAKETRTALDYLESEKIPFYNTGGRVGLKKGKMPFSPSRRGFLQWLAGITGATVAAGTGLLKWGAKKGAGKTVIKAGDHIIQGTQGMPDWFIPLVNRIVKEGDDVTAKLATKEREIVHTKKIEGHDVDVYQDLTTGDIRVSVESGTGKHLTAYDEGLSLEYKAGEVIEEGTMKGQKTTPEFNVAETEARYYQVGPDDAELELEHMLQGQPLKYDKKKMTYVVDESKASTDEILSDTNFLKNYAKKKKPNMGQIVETTKKKKYNKYLNDNPHEDPRIPEGPEPDYDDYLPDIDDIE